MQMYDYKKETYQFRLTQSESGESHNDHLHAGQPEEPVTRPPNKLEPQNKKDL